MPQVSIAPYFPFRRVKITAQRFTSEGVLIDMEPNRRSLPRCARCGTTARDVDSTGRRWIRDLDLAGTRVWLNCRIRKVFCPRCQKVRVEWLEFAEAGQRVTKRLARYLYQLCQLLPISDVCLLTGLNHKTIKAIDKLFLKEEFGRIDPRGVRILAVDEVSERKGHKYLTIVIDHETGRVLYVGKNRRARTLKRFFRLLSRRQRRQIQAIAMDMWDPYIKAVRRSCPQAKIVFDLFHVRRELSKLIDQERNREYRLACAGEKAVLKGSKFLLLSHRSRLSRRQQIRLDQLLRLNKRLATMYMLKDQLNVIWRQRTIRDCLEALNDWVMMALESSIRSAISFARRLKRYAYGILNHALFPIHTGRLEGINNKIKVIKRRCYGFHHSEYFSLKIKQAFPGRIFN